MGCWRRTDSLSEANGGADPERRQRQRPGEQAKGRKMVCLDFWLQVSLYEGAFFPSELLCQGSLRAEIGIFLPLPHLLHMTPRRKRTQVWGLNNLFIRVHRKDHMGLSKACLTLSLGRSVILNEKQAAGADCLQR